MAKSKDAFRTISEVAEWLDEAPHVLRYWETKFSAVKPVKRAGGRRYYRTADMRVLGGVRKLLHDDGMTIKSVQKMISEDGVNAVAAYSRPLPFEKDETAHTPPMSPPATACALETAPSGKPQDTKAAAQQSHDFHVEGTPLKMQASLYPKDSAEAASQSEPKQTAPTEAPVALDVPLLDETPPPEAEVVTFIATAPLDTQTPTGGPILQIKPVHMPADPTGTEFVQGPTISSLIAKISPEKLRANAQLILPLRKRLAALATKMDTAK
jgi:DNA-binding transcriptional MerR regulator